MTREPWQVHQLDLRPLIPGQVTVTAATLKYSLPLEATVDAIKAPPTEQQIYCNPGIPIYKWNRNLYAGLRIHQ